MSDYKVSEDKLKRKRSEKIVILKAMTASNNQFEKRLGSLETERRVLEKTDEGLMRTCGKGNAVLRKRLGKQLKSVATHFVMIAIFIGRAIRK